MNRAGRRRRPFRKLLVANRGEIARRIIRTCRSLGIATVAVHSDADQDASHVDDADEAVRIGPAPASESYLSRAALLDAARTTRAEAIHPGYGFLSENADFARAVEEAELAFVGPRPDTIALMGDKLAAKKLAVEAGVPTVPGHAEPADDVNSAVRMADDIGYPVMLKAAAGGGGKGMRIAWNRRDVEEGLERARGEAQSGFGDGRIFVERYFPDPRHIEVQVLGDGRGTCISLGERDCSIQRRHQKVLEETPAPHLDPDLRARIEDRALALALAVDYRSAGTVEFIVDQEGGFHFLEMNTRLQVEHPVTEMVTGIDLVEQMIRVAAGQPLGIRQADVKRHGWAIEARVYAEDPERGFLPSIGRVRRMVPPPSPADGDGGLRIDAGLVEGSTITPHYDPMVAKLIAYGPDRPAAVTLLGDALDGFYLRGPETNLRFLADLVRRPSFRSGNLDTGFLAREYGDDFEAPPCTGPVRDVLLFAAAFLGRHAERRTGGVPFDESALLERVVLLGETSVSVTLAGPDGQCTLTFEDRTVHARADWVPGHPVLRGTFETTAFSVQVDPAPEGWFLTHGGLRIHAASRRPDVAALAVHMPVRQEADRSGELRSPMPGLVLSVAVKEGDHVRMGEVVAVVEAMKVENALRSERDGTIAAVGVSEGDNIAADDLIVEFVGSSPA